MNDWKITFLIRGKDSISVNVKSNNEIYARQNATRKLLMQYGYLHLKHGEYEVVSARLLHKPIL